MTIHKILVIDDEESIRDVIKLCLEIISGWNVIMAISGEEGLEIAKKEQPELILLDVMMPELSGIKTFKRLKANIITVNIPVIFLTAKAGISEQKELKELGVNGIIVKPFDPQYLVTDIKKILHWD